MSNWLNATLIKKTQWAPGLYSLFVDAPLETFEAGQFGRLGLEIDGKIVGRPYSFVNAPHERPFEFLFVTVESGLLTPRLEALEPGDPLFMFSRPSGLFTLASVRPADQLWCFSTGTALGVFVSLLKTKALWTQFKKVVLVQGARTKDTISHQPLLQHFKTQYPSQFEVVYCLTQEVDAQALSGRIPLNLNDGTLEKYCSAPIRPQHTQAMICGNPAMVKETQTVLEGKGLVRHMRHAPGQIHIENYWKD